MFYKILLVLFFISISNITFADGNYVSQGYSNIDYGDYTVLVPANTIFTVKLLNSINSETLNKGDSVAFYLPSDFYYHNILIIPQGSKLNATVIDVAKGSTKKQAEINIRCLNIITPYGKIIPVSAAIKTDDDSGILKSKMNSKIAITQNTDFDIILKQHLTFSSNNPY